MIQHGIPAQGSRSSIAIVGARVSAASNALTGDLAAARSASDV